MAIPYRQITFGGIRSIVRLMSDADLLVLCWRVSPAAQSLAWITTAQAEASRRGLYADEPVWLGLKSRE